MTMDVSIIVPICIRENIHLVVLKNCLNSIVSNIKYKNIYLINDSDISFYNCIDNLTKSFNNVFMIETYKKGSADQQVFKLIFEINDNSDLYLIIQDSMFINLNLDKLEKVDKLQFLWHFTNHRLHWDNIYEPSTEYNIINKIRTHTDLIKHHLYKNYSNDKDFLEWALKSLINKDNWVGCFGNCCLITKKTVDFLNSKTDFINKFINCTTNRERRMNETIFSLICHYYLPEINYEDSYDGLYYDGITINSYSNIPVVIDNYNLVFCARNKYLSKISFNR